MKRAFFSLALLLSFVTAVASLTFLHLALIEKRGGEEQRTFEAFAVAIFIFFCTVIILIDRNYPN